MSSVQKVTFLFEKGQFQNFYEALGVDMDATDEEILHHYRALSKIHHPDNPNGDPEMMNKLSKAYNFLKDPIMRAVYDLFYKDIIYRQNSFQDNCKESVQSTESETSNKSINPITQEISKSCTKSVESTTQNISKATARSQRTNHSISTNKNSSYNKNYTNSNKKKGTSYHFKVSPNAIRSTLEHHHYSEKTIDNFLLWCQEHHMKITNGKDLHSVFLKYLSMTKEMAISEEGCLESITSSNRKNVRYHLRRDNYYHRKKDAKQDTRKEFQNHSIFHFPFQRELKACQTFVKDHSMSSIRNLQIFNLQYFATLIHMIQNVIVFWSENRNRYRKGDVKIKEKHY